MNEEDNNELDVDNENEQCNTCGKKHINNMFIYFFEIFIFI